MAIPAYVFVPLALFFMLGAGSMFGVKAAKAAQLPSKNRVLRVETDGRPYFVVALGGGKYEVRREDKPDVFVLFDQTLGPGHPPLSTGGSEADLTALRHDMPLFPATMFT
jgi:hypothetical protein